MTGCTHTHTENSLTTWSCHETCRWNKVRYLLLLMSFTLHWTGNMSRRSALLWPRRQTLACCDRWKIRFTEDKYVLHLIQVSNMEVLIFSARGLRSDTNGIRCRPPPPTRVTRMTQFPANVTSLLLRVITPSPIQTRRRHKRRDAIGGTHSALRYRYVSWE